MEHPEFDASPPEEPTAQGADAELARIEALPPEERVAAMEALERRLRETLDDVPDG